jgi:hypothetical protein
MEVNYGAPVSISRGDNIGCLLFLLLEREPHECDKKIARYPVAMDIRLSSTFYHRKGTSLTNTSVTWFNNFIEQNIKNIMMTYVKALLQDEPQRIKAKAINKFLQKYSFRPDDFPFETAKKHVDRHYNNISN